MDFNLYEKRKISSVYLLVATMIWGASFLAQSEGAKHIGPFFFNASRFWIGALAILPMSLFRTYKSIGKLGFWQDWEDKRETVKGAFLDGILVFISFTLQQIGIGFTSPGKAGFLVSLSIIFVPIIGIFLGKKVMTKQWIGVFAALFGTSLLSLNSTTGINKGDLLIIGSAFTFALSLIVSGHYNKKVESLKFTMFRFVFAGIICTIITLVLEKTTINMIENALIAILFSGIFASGIAFTLQSVSQIYLDDLTTSLFLSLESVFAAIFAWLFVGEILSRREILGCIILFGAVIFIQLVQEKDEDITYLK